MSCTRLARRMAPAPIWHRLLCGECRTARRADAVLGFALACRRARAATEPLDGLYRALHSLNLPLDAPLTWRARVHALRRRLQWPVLALAVVSTATVAGYLRWIEIDPNVAVPTPTLAGPNAFDDLQRAAAMLVDTKHANDLLTALDKAAADQKAAAVRRPGVAAPGAIAASGPEMMGGSPPLAASSPAAPTIGMPPPAASPVQSGAPQNIAAVIRNVSLRRTYPDALPGMLSWMPDVAEVLQENAPALAAMREGFRHPYLAPPVRSASALMPYLSDYKPMARLLRLDAYFEAARGHLAASAQLGLDCVELGIHVQRGTTSNKSTGIGCEAIGRRTVTAALEHLTALEARAAASRLLTLDGQRVPTDVTFEEQKWSDIAWLKEIMRQPYWRLDTRWFNPTFRGPNWPFYVRSLAYSKRCVIADYTKSVDSAIAKVRLLNVPMVGAAPTVADDPIIEAMLPDYAELRVHDDADAAQNRLLATALALRAYHLDHGQYPVGLDPLATKPVTAIAGVVFLPYLSSVPLDPFTQGQPLHYARRGTSYILYSVGPDGVDNGGQPIGSGGKPKPGGFTSQDTGDLVFGANTD